VQTVPGERHEATASLAAVLTFAALSIAFVLLISVTGCMRRTQIGDPALQPFESMYSIDRAKYGFTPLPKSGVVYIEGRSLHGDYDAMLHFQGNSYRTIAFRWDGKVYQWLGEQENFEGPREYETPDGRFHEWISIAYYDEAIFGEPKGAMIIYRGPEPMRMPGPETNWSLTLAEVKPLLRKWGFRQ